MLKPQPIRNSQGTDGEIAILTGLQIDVISDLLYMLIDV